MTARLEFKIDRKLLDILEKVWDSEKIEIHLYRITIEGYRPVKLHDIELEIFFNNSSLRVVGEGKNPKWVELNSPDGVIYEKKLNKVESKLVSEFLKMLSVRALTEANVQIVGCIK